MVCNKCRGKVLVDRTFDQNTSIELYCLTCGKRWMLSRTSSLIGRTIDRLERQLSNG